MALRCLLATSKVLLCVASMPICFGQSSSSGAHRNLIEGAVGSGAMPPDYTGVRTRIPGVFVTPVPGQPFSAKVDIFSTQLLPDGRTVTRKTMNRIARDSSGRIHNERRRLVSQDLAVSLY